MVKGEWILSCSANIRVALRMRQLRVLLSPEKKDGGFVMCNDVFYPNDPRHGL